MIQGHASAAAQYHGLCSISWTKGAGKPADVRSAVAPSRSAVTPELERSREEASSSSSPAPAVTRAAAVLDVLAADPHGRATLSDLAGEIGIPKSFTTNIL